MTITVKTLFHLNFTYFNIVMPSGPRFALSEFSIFTYTKPENTVIENSDFPKVGQNKEVFVRHLQGLSFEISPKVKSKTLTILDSDRVSSR